MSVVEMSVTMAAGKGAKRKDVEELFETTPVEDIRVILTGTTYTNLWNAQLFGLRSRLKNEKIHCQVWKKKWTVNERS